MLGLLWLVLRHPISGLLHSTPRWKPDHPQVRRAMGLALNVCLSGSQTGRCLTSAEAVCLAELLKQSQIYHTCPWLGGFGELAPYMPRTCAIHG